MKRAGVVAAMAVASLLVVGSLTLLDPGSDRDTGHGNELLFPELLDAVNDVARLTTRHAGKSLSAELEGGRWVVPERGNYPANEDAIRKIIVAMAQIRKLQPMTRMPERYEKLGLEPPDDEDAYSVQISLENRTGESLGSVILGHRDPSKVDDNANEIYVRRPQDPQTWRVESSVPHPTEPADLLALEVADIERDRVKRVEVRHGDGHEVIVSRARPDQEDFVLENLPEQTEVIYDWAINDVGRVLTNLELTDVRPVSEVSFGDQPLGIELITFDGLRVRMESVQTDEGQFARLEAGAAQPVEGLEHRALLAPDAVTEEIATLNRRWRGWAFTFSTYRYNTFTKPMGELVRPVAAGE